MSRCLLQKHFLFNLVLGRSLHRQDGFFDTYQVLGVATEIMDIKPEGWDAIEKMRQGK
ncbi:hypothetical protein GO755_13060 [Spirosoma sp. HMF4905]|uniref:Uncharacterized protein n=1 Tax=Spirosoma arboris TaxID=2682092 RepID=A0A7K1SAX3_9BACT|nr:hypothetical protein [Spirosoma arboris]MVM30964.1 hypothetical protein [Spirosoma arboris]